MTTTRPERYARALADELDATGRLSGPWRSAYEAVQRHLFIPDVAWAVPDGPEPGYAVDHTADAALWWSTIYSDASLVTQLDDGAGDVRTGIGTPTCSCSAPGIVFHTLDTLGVRHHHRVLEIGTGTGWTAALLSHRVGAANVVSIEVDEQVATQAAKNVTTTGFTPRLITGDGAAGWPDSAPYDRVHVTCGIETLPYAWVTQTRPGGVIVAPWAATYGHGLLVRLTVDAEGNAYGRFHGDASYMMLRSQRRTAKWAPHHTTDAHTETTRIDPREIAEAPSGAGLTIAATAPGIARIAVPAEDDSGGFSPLLTEPGREDGAWAAVDYAPGATEYQVTWYGDRNLWQEVSTGYLHWISTGMPTADRFGLYLNSQTQHLWLDHPTQRLSLLL